MTAETQAIWWEKRGNTTWVGCPDCRGWFHVAPRLLKHTDAELFCPFCRKWFRQDRIVATAAP